jgi:DNA-binding MarR family transcriptional regulator
MKPNGDFDLTRYLPYLINRAGIRLAGAFTAAIRRRGITLQMWRVLAALNHADGQRVSDLAELTSIDVSTLSRLLGAMQKKGFVERRRPGRGDARIVTVRVTERGRAATARVIPLARRYEAVALAGFTAGEQLALKAMLVRVYGNIGAIESAGALDKAA